MAEKVHLIKMTLGVIQSLPVSILILISPKWCPLSTAYLTTIHTALQQNVLHFFLELRSKSCANINNNDTTCNNWGRIIANLKWSAQLLFSILPNYLLLDWNLNNHHQVTDQDIMANKSNIRLRKKTTRQKKKKQTHNVNIQAHRTQVLKKQLQV